MTPHLFTPNGHSELPATTERQQKDGGGVVDANCQR